MIGFNLEDLTVWGLENGSEIPISRITVRTARKARDRVVGMVPEVPGPIGNQTHNLRMVGSGKKK